MIENKKVESVWMYVGLVLITDYQVEEFLMFGEKKNQTGRNWNLFIPVVKFFMECRIILYFFLSRTEREWKLGRLDIATVKKKEGTAA